MSGINYLENTRTQMKKGILEFCILAVIHGEEAYASDILEKLRQAELLVVEGTLYPLLTRLKNAGLLSYDWRESQSGPPRKYYKLTEDGELTLKELDKTWQDIKQAVEQATKSK
jgi:PadR family transcriptional regulator PadR